jgi:hypothetical protein
MAVAVALGGRKAGAFYIDRNLTDTADWLAEYARRQVGAKIRHAERSGSSQVSNATMPERFEG